jgi:hypothetical protein
VPTAAQTTPRSPRASKCASALNAPVFLYASEDDEVVPFAHRDLWIVADDIRSL